MKEQKLVSLVRNPAKTRQVIAQKRGKAKKVVGLKAKDFLFLHIEELTFEEESPRKEALENVISSLGIAGINFVYLLQGDSNGVSFYFGVVKDLSFSDDLALDVDDIGRYLLKSSIEGNFRGSKITEQTGREGTSHKQDVLQKIRNMKRFAKVEGVPSVNEDSESFQGVDRLVDVMMGDEFALMVLADPLMTEEVQQIQASLYEIYNKLAPNAKYSVQESTGKTITNGTNRGKNSSKTGGTSMGTSDSGTKGTADSGSSTSTNKSRTESKNIGSSSSNTIGSSEGDSYSEADNIGSNTSREFADKEISEWLEYIDGVLLKRVEYGKNKSLFDVGIYLCANEKGTLLKLGNTIRSLFSGKEDNKAPLSLHYLDANPHEIMSVKNLQLPVTNLNIEGNLDEACLLFSQKSNKLSNWMSTNELSVITGLPQKEVVGLPLKEEVEFGLNIKKVSTDNVSNRFVLGNLVKSGMPLKVEVSLDKNELDKHTFITGTTGSGKTTTCHRILHEAQMPYMVIEPAKTEYRVLTNKEDDLLIFTLGNETIAPFRINPFEFFKGENISSRVDMIKANIEAAFDMEAAIPQIIEAALYQCYEIYGWDIASSTNVKFEDPFAEGVYAFPTLSDLITQTKEVVKNQGFDERLQNDYTGSIKARLQGLIQGAKGFMLDTPRSVDFLKLVERKVVLELEEIKNGAEKSLIMGFVLINLNEAIKQKHIEYQKIGKQFKHITLIEEAHRLLSKSMPGDNPSKKLGVETFSDMLAEVRKYGESLIIVDQIPDKLTPDVLKNTNTKIVHKLFASDDKNAIGNTMALDDEQKNFLSNLERGRAIVSSQDFSKPIQVQIKPLDDISTTKSGIVDESVIRALCLSFYQQNYKKGVIKGMHLFSKEPTLAQIECFLSLETRMFLDVWKEFCQKENINNPVADIFDIKLMLGTGKGEGLLAILEEDVSFVANLLVLMCYSYKDNDEKNKLLSILPSLLNDLINGDKTAIEDDNDRIYLKINKER